MNKPVIKKPVKSSFAAFRAQMKKTANQPPEGSDKAETKTIDFGFFKVASPVKTPSPHCEGWLQIFYLINCKFYTFRFTFGLHCRGTMCFAMPY